MKKLINRLFISQKKKTYRYFKKAKTIVCLSDNKEYSVELSSFREVIKQKNSYWVKSVNGEIVLIRMFNMYAKIID